MREFSGPGRREEWTAPIPYGEVRQAAESMRRWHEGRVDHWQSRQNAATTKFKESVNVREVPQTMGYRAEVEHDAQASRDLMEADGKVKAHRRQAESFASYCALLDRLDRDNPAGLLELDQSDVLYFRLGMEPLPADHEEAS